LPIINASLRKIYGSIINDMAGKLIEKNKPSLFGQHALTLMALILLFLGLLKNKEFQKSSIYNFQC